VAYDRAVEMASAGSDARPVRPRGVRRRRDAVAVVIAVTLFVPAALIAHTERVSGFEAAIFRAINHLPDALFPVANTAQFLGILGVGPIVALVALLCRRARLAIAALLVTAGKLAVEKLVIWPLVFRARPGTSTPGAIVRGDTPVAGAAFVSGHVILITALAWIVTPYLRGRWRWAPWVIVAVVIFARVYLGAHNPLDVLGGFAMGLVVGGAVNLVVGISRGAEPEDITA
jgi:undecaprenyl-diphosphatase